MLTNVFSAHVSDRPARSVLHTARGRAAVNPYRSARQASHPLGCGDGEGGGGGGSRAISINFVCLRLSVCLSVHLCVLHVHSFVGPMSRGRDAS